MTFLAQQPLCCCFRVPDKGRVTPFSATREDQNVQRTLERRNFHVTVKIEFQLPIFQPLSRFHGAHRLTFYVSPVHLEATDAIIMEATEYNNRV